MSLDDPARVERLLDDCMARGLVEDVDGDVRATRHWKAWVQKGAEVLNREVAETGWTPPGNPVRYAVAKALSMKGEDLPEADRADIVELLTNLELANMPEWKREDYLERDRRAMNGP